MFREETLEGAQDWYNNIKKIGKIFAWIFIIALITEVLLDLNPETFIENYALGIVGIIMWSILYIVPYPEIRIFRYKSLYLFLAGFSAAWLIADWVDFRDFAFAFLGAVA